MSLADFTECGDPTAGAVMSGVDIVATYLNANASLSGASPQAPVMGSALYNYTSDEGFTFWFSSAGNVALYASSPETFPLGAGGYCGLAVSGNDPACNYEVCKGPACITEAATNQVAPDGKLYFFLGAGAVKQFNEDAEGNAANCASEVERVEDSTGISCFNTDLFRCNS